MAPTFPGSRLAVEALGEVAECLDGTVHLAYAQTSALFSGAEPGVAIVAAGFSPHEAHARARRRAWALDLLHRLPHEGAGPLDAAAQELSLTDFVPDLIPGLPPGLLPGLLPGAVDAGRPVVTGTGLLTGRPYALPIEVVWAGDRDCPVEPTTVGVVDKDVPAAVAELLAHDVLSRWWAAPGLPLTRLSTHLDQLLPPGVASAASGLGLGVSAFLLPASDGRIALALVGVAGDGAAIATAAAPTAGEAVGQAFLRAMAARAQPWSTLAAADSLRRFAVWHREADYVTYLERWAVDADPRALDAGEAGAAELTTPDWAAIARRRFGHEPVVVEAGTSHEAVKVVCPGAACYGASPSGATLPCPVL
ncbi:hypothetical protein N5079_23670 [Planotetraspora sp. A-T 1434]|uniref:hypothetical protein n=1 Tax=Planotetraspora sp. A-T 1434 TaxID=2979219 RepID=UPI0021C0F11D|nr:hypothetical protein [Planotetraspora sp. A-T 1434]MCT9933213.1 hypothetical protein [Planotetraspora sp. A-T 1434]